MLVVPEVTTTYLRAAQQELCYFFKKATGIDLKTTTDTGLGGAQGWYAIGPLAANDPLEAELAAKDGEAWKSFLLGKFSGFFLRVR